MSRAPLALLVAVTLTGAAANLGCSSEPELRLAPPQDQIAAKAARDAAAARRELPNRVRTRMPVSIRHQRSAPAEWPGRTGCTRYGRPRRPVRPRKSNADHGSVTEQRRPPR